MSTEDVSHMWADPQRAWTDRDLRRLQELRARITAAAPELIERPLDNVSFADWDDGAASSTPNRSFATAGQAVNATAAFNDSFSRSGLATTTSPFGHGPEAEAQGAGSAGAATTTTTEIIAGNATAGMPPPGGGGGIGGLDSTVVESTCTFAMTHRACSRTLEDAEQRELVLLEDRYARHLKEEKDRRAADQSEQHQSLDVGSLLQRAGKASWFWTSLVATASAAVASNAGIIPKLQHWDVVLAADREAEVGALILGALPVVTGLDHIDKLKKQCEKVGSDLGLIVSCMHEDEMHGFGLSAFATHTRWYEAFGVTSPPQSTPVPSPPTGTPTTEEPSATSGSDTTTTSRALTVGFPVHRPDGTGHHAAATAGNAVGTATQTNNHKTSATTGTTAPTRNTGTPPFRCMLFQIDDCSATGATDAQMVSTVDAIHQTLHAGRSVYVHCKAGKGRSWMVVACYLLTHWPPARASDDPRTNLNIVSEHIRGCRAQVNPSSSQLLFAERYARLVLDDLEVRTQQQMRLRSTGAAAAGRDVMGHDVPMAFSNGVVMSHHHPATSVSSVSM